jgi:hypothetical protein
MDVAEINTGAGANKIQSAVSESSHEVSVEKLAHGTKESSISMAKSLEQSLEQSVKDNVQQTVQKSVQQSVQQESSRVVQQSVTSSSQVEEPKPVAPSTPPIEEQKPEVRWQQPQEAEASAQKQSQPPVEVVQPQAEPVQQQVKPAQQQYQQQSQTQYAPPTQQPYESQSNQQQYRPQFQPTQVVANKQNEIKQENIKNTLKEIISDIDRVIEQEEEEKSTVIKGNENGTQYQQTSYENVTKYSAYKLTGMGSDAQRTPGYSNSYPSRPAFNAKDRSSTLPTSKLFTPKQVN